MSCDQCQTEVSLERFLGIEDGPILEKHEPKIFCSELCFRTYLSTRARRELTYRCTHCVKIKKFSEMTKPWTFCHNNGPLKVIRPCCQTCPQSEHCQLAVTLLENGNIKTHMELVSNVFNPNKCGVCEKPGIHKCSQCLTVRYCSVRCQRKDWAQHKSTCHYDKELADLTEVLREFTHETGCQGPIIIQMNH